MVNSIITTALGSHGPRAFLSAVGQGRAELTSYCATVGDTIAGAASRDWSTLPHASTLADRVLGLPEADDPAVDAWTPYHASDILHPKRARIIPLAEPTNPLLQRGIPLAGAYEPFGARAADKTAHSLNLRRTGVPPSLTNPTYAPDNPRSDSNGWFREEIDDADDGFVHLEPNKVYLSYNSDFNTPSDPTDNPLLYYDLLPDPEPLPSSIPSPQPPPPSSSSPVSNFNSLSALCGLDEEGIHNYLGEELYGHFDQIRELVVGDPTKGIPSFLELNPINNTKGKTAFNLGGVWIIVSV